MKEIPFAPGYFCDCDGCVTSFRESKNGKKLKPHKHKRDGVLSHSFRINGESKVYKLSYIVARTFISNPYNHLHVGHKNGITDDCRLENLFWYTNPQIDEFGRFKKGRISENEIWNEEYLKSKLTEFVLKFYNQHGFVLPSTQIKSYDSKLFSAFRHRLNNPNQYYLDLLVELGLPLPSNSYYKDNHIFRGFYELVGYCFIKSWGIPFEPFKVLNFDGKFYISDGYFSEINVYWEHFGGLNPNNKLKKQFYKIKKYSLIQTNDDECQKTNKGIKFLYETLRESLLPFYPNIPEYVQVERLKLISASVPDFDQIMEFISNVLIQNNQTVTLDERVLRETADGYKVISLINKFFDGRVTLLKEELNKRGFNFDIKAQRGSYKNLEYFVQQIGPIIKQFGRVPTQKEFSEMGRNDIPIMATKLCGGIEQLRRNEIEEGKFFYITKSILHDDAPFDKKLDWSKGSTDYTIKKLLNYFNIKNIPLPQTLNSFRYNLEYQPFGKQLHTQINRDYIGGWDKFKQKYYE